jgi:hypothetical protein
MKGKTVAILESRMRDHIASLVRKYGGTPFSAPALAEIPDVDPAHIDELIRDWNSASPDIFIFQTGVGTRALFAATDSVGLTDVLLRLLDSAQVVVRAPSRPRCCTRARCASTAPPAAEVQSVLRPESAPTSSVNLVGITTGAPSHRPRRMSLANPL